MSTSAAASYTITDLGTLPGGTQSVAHGINAECCSPSRCSNGYCRLDAGQPCTGGDQCIFGGCVGGWCCTGSVVQGDACRPIYPCCDGICVNGFCACIPTGQLCGTGPCCGLCCSGTCVDPNTDPTNCGVCGKVCPGFGCQGAVCCKAPGILCGGDAECCSRHCVQFGFLSTCSG